MIKRYELAPGVIVRLEQDHELDVVVSLENAKQPTNGWLLLSKDKEIIQKLGFPVEPPAQIEPEALKAREAI